MMDHIFYFSCMVPGPLVLQKEIIDKVELSWTSLWICAAAAGIPVFTFSLLSESTLFYVKIIIS